MGQGYDKACCSSFCAPEDPSVEQRSQLDAKGKSPAYPLINSEHTPGSPATSGAVAATAMPPAIYGGGAEEQEAFYIPPPPPGGVEDFAPSPSAPLAAVAAMTSPPSGPAPTTQERRTTLSFEAVVTDIEGSELSEYGACFANLAGASGVVQPDNEGLRDFVATNSVITLDEIDTELLKIASTNNDFTIDCDGFLTLLRENSIMETDALEQFLNLSSNGESITAEDCRSGLLNLTEQKLSANLTTAQLESIFDGVMVDVGLNVSMEQWINCCKRVARIVRLLRCARI